MQMLPRSLPENLDDITVQVALVRPGPIQGGAVHPYLERKKRLREDPAYEIPYEHPSLAPILADTLGAIVFQDQVIQVAMALAGFRAGEAEGLRRAMSRKRSEEALDAYRERFVEGADRERRLRGGRQPRLRPDQGLLRLRLPEVARRRLRPARLPVDLAAASTTAPSSSAALLNEQPMGFYPPDALVHEAQRRGIAVLGPDVNASAVLCRCEWQRPSEPAPRRRSSGSGSGSATSTASPRPTPRPSPPPAARAAPTATSATSPPARAPRATVSRSSPGPTPARASTPAPAGYAASGATPCGRSASPAVPAARKARRRRRASEQLPLPIDLPDAPPLASQSAWERVTADYSAYGMSLGEHPMALMRGELDPATVTSADLSGSPTVSRS